MQIIITADPEDMAAVFQLVQEKAPMFDRDKRPGWGWSFSIPNGKRFFLCDTKRGISARPAKEYVPHQTNHPPKAPSQGEGGSGDEFSKGEAK